MIVWGLSLKVTGGCTRSWQIAPSLEVCRLLKFELMKFWVYPCNVAVSLEILAAGVVVLLDVAEIPSKRALGLAVSWRVDSSAKLLLPYLLYAERRVLRASWCLLDLLSNSAVLRGHPHLVISLAHANIILMLGHIMHVCIGHLLEILSWGRLFVLLVLLGVGIDDWL